MSDTESTPREKATATEGQCTVCGKPVAVKETLPDGAQVLAACKKKGGLHKLEAERAEAELPRETGTDVEAQA